MRTNTFFFAALALQVFLGAYFCSLYGEKYKYKGVSLIFFIELDLNIEQNLHLSW